MRDRDGKDTAVLTLTGGSSSSRSLGIEIAAFEENNRTTRYVVRLPGGWEARGYVGEDEVEFVRTGANA